MGNHFSKNGSKRKNKRTKNERQKDDSSNVKRIYQTYSIQKLDLNKSIYEEEELRRYPKN